MQMTQARRAWIEQRLRTLRSERTHFENVRNGLNGQLGRLREARDRMNAELSTHGELRRNVREAMTPIGMNRLRGDNRNRMSNRTTTLYEHLGVQRDRHQENRDLVNGRITTREQERDAAVSNLGAVNNEINRLQQELNAVTRIV